MVRRVFLMALNMSLQLLAQNSTAAASDVAVDNGSDWTYHDEEWHGNHELLPCSGEGISEHSFDLIRPIDYSPE